MFNKFFDRLFNGSNERDIKKNAAACGRKNQPAGISIEETE